ncbi:MAG: TolC family protein [Gemmatimonadaceae bacterium]|jgi:cobalt-zinc-cadmium efflux system outer membrane protein|nr:TolC family protein [Gemmatimonadaceae bacterium]
MPHRPRSPNPRRRWGERPRVALLLLLATAPAIGRASAQGLTPAPADTLSLGTAIRAALEGTPAARMIDGRAEIGRGRARQDAQWTNPMVDFRRENIGSPLLPDVFTTLYLPFDPTRRRAAFRRAATAGVARAGSDRDAERQQLAWSVAQAFFRALLTQEARETAARRRSALEALAAFDSVRAREGAVAEVIAMRARLEADRARAQEAQAIAEESRERQALARWLGRPAAHLGALAPLLPPDALGPLDDVERLVADALRDRAEVRARREALAEATARSRAEARGALPEWQLQGGSKRTSGITTAQLGVLVPLPLFHRNDAARERARGEERVADAELRDTETRVRGEVLAAVAAYDALRASRPERSSTFAARGAEIAAIVRTAYREGAATLVELLDAERAEAEARLSAIQWMIDLHRARLDVTYARGQSLLEWR